jgi:hypothetical protein
MYTSSNVKENAIPVTSRGYKIVNIYFYISYNTFLQLFLICEWPKDGQPRRPKCFVVVCAVHKVTNFVLTVIKTISVALQ